MNKYKNSKQDDFYKSVLEADLLIIDDLGTECLNSMKLSELFTILNTRLLNLNNKVTKTIISTITLVFGFHSHIQLFIVVFCLKTHNLLLI